MSQQLFFNCIYGGIFIALVYLIVRMLYSVEYTPGSTVVYNSPIAQKIFPKEANKMFPTWGYNDAGMVKNDPTKYGQNGFWPQSGTGYQPSKYGSGGPSPSGGMRSAGIGTDFTSVGYWGGDITYPERQVFDIYANDAEIPEKTVTTVGWWGDSVL
jgi:hypothetical protein